MDILEGGPLSSRPEPMQREAPTLADLAGPCNIIMPCIRIICAHYRGFWGFQQPDPLELNTKGSFWVEGNVSYCVSDGFKFKKDT